MRILLVEDDREVADYVGRGLEEEGNTITICFDGTSGLRTAQTSAFDIIVLDVMLPFMDGFEITRRLRAGAVATPILLLTGRDCERDVVQGLDAGADDYLTKPFSLEVLLAHLRARTRESQGESKQKLRYSDLTINLETREVWRGNTPITLTRTEFSILECLMRSAGRAVMRKRLIETVWGDNPNIGSNNLDAFIRLLRTKIDAQNKRMIHTVRGVGYSLRREA